MAYSLGQTWTQIARAFSTALSIIRRIVMLWHVKIAEKPDLNLNLGLTGRRSWPNAKNAILYDLVRKIELLAGPLFMALSALTAPGLASQRSNVSLKRHRKRKWKAIRKITLKPEHAAEQLRFARAWLPKINQLKVPLPLLLPLLFMILADADWISLL